MKKHLISRRHADTPTRRHADTPTRRHADTPTRRHADTPTHIAATHCCVIFDVGINPGDCCTNHLLP
ncbi:MAG: hypothetical protein SFV22_20720 [Saprospiraceae bacterium]|nr:hypothetical protein [Saprospiraceae bacterium]